MGMYFYRHFILFSLIVLSLTGFSCSQTLTDDVEVSPDSIFSGPIALGKIKNNSLSEVSGIVVSRSNPKYLWVHNDSGDDPRLFLIDREGNHKGVFYLDGVPFVDVEDIAIGPGPIKGVNYIYVGDIGDNLTSRDVKYIYRFPEPHLPDILEPLFDHIKDIEIIKYQYSDKRRDAETLVIDPDTKDIFIISKREPEVKVYQAKNPTSVNDTIIFNNIGQLPFPLIVGGDIAANGKEVILKSYENVYYWELPEEKTFESIINTDPVRLPYEREPQGEAIAWDTDASGYFTLSEELFIFEAVLYYYEKLQVSGSTSE